MLSTNFRRKMMKKFGFFHYALARKMFRRPLMSTALFVVEFCFVSYGYVVLHNLLSPADVAITYSKSMYFTVISATTVGYGDHYPIHAITQWYVILLMIMYLPFRFFYTAGVAGFLFRVYQNLKHLGRWFPMLYDHIIVYCNAHTIERNNFLWFERFVEEKGRSLKYKDKEILLVNGNQDANEKLVGYFSERGEKFKHVHFVNANLNEEGFFDKIHINAAERVYVLADEQDISSDSNVFDMVYRIDKETDYCNGVTAELVNDSNRERIAKLGANVILRPNRSMPEMLITCTIAPGSAQMIEEISARGGDSIERFAISCDAFVWGELLYHLSMKGIGTATAVVYDRDGTGLYEEIDSNPEGASIIKDAKGILLLVHEMRSKSYEDVQSSIDAVVADLKKQDRCNVEK